MAALAADASRLVEVSPSSAIASMRTFCEWAADIALDIYKVQVVSGVTQMEKLEALQATGRVPAEILQKFHNIRTAGNDAVHRALGDPETARAALQETKEIGQWLFRESDSHARPRDPSPIRRVPIEGLYADEEPSRSSGMLESRHSQRMRPAQFFRQYAPQVVMGGGVLLIIGIIVLVILLVSRCSNPSRQLPDDSIGPSTSPLSTGLVEETPTAEPTPAPSPTPRPSVWFETLDPSSDFTGLYLGKWDSTSMDANFQLDGRLYEHGIGMFVPSRQITDDRGSKSATWALLGKYDTLVFDLGADQNWDYGQNNGYFRIKIEADDKEVYNSGMKDYQFFEENITVDVRGCNSLKITITEQKGDAGTLNIVLGNARLYEVSTATGGTSAPTGTPGASETPGASPSPTPAP
ncbi:MAG: DUF4145 domain-containing protein [Clostridiales bacterium]|nr:DUF4145 domain-containing protein [Clostridiales bacterium]